MLLLFVDTSVVQAQEGIACIAENEYGEDAEDKVDGYNGNIYGGAIAEWDKHDENAE